MQEEMFVSLSNLKSLELHKNPWRCDCHLKTFRYTFRNCTAMGIWWLNGGDVEVNLWICGGSMRK